MALDPHRFQEVTHQSWFSRIGGATKGVVIGLVMFAVSFPLLFWNEGRAVRRYRTLVEGAGAVVSAPADPVDAANQGALVHVSAEATSDTALSDLEFGVTANGIKLNRLVEVYQWRETSESEERTKIGGGTETVTTYEYELVWDDSLIDSSLFRRPTGHQNPASMPFESRRFTAPDVLFGAFTLADSQVGQISDFRPLPLPADTPPPAALQGSGTMSGGGFYIGDPINPTAGDTRVTFSVVDPGEYSIIAAQTGETFEPYRTSAGGTIELVTPGVRSAESMFASAQAENTLLTWALRVFGFVLMFMGIGLVLRPLSVLADVLPILGNIVGAGTGLIAGLVAAVLSLLTISIAWLFYRPLLGVALLVVAAGLTYLIRTKLRGSGGERAQPA